MLDFLTATGNLPFVVALLIVAMLGLIEVLGMLTGFSASGMLDEWFDPSASDAADVAGYSTALDRFLGWLHFGKVPALILIATFLLVFGVVGLSVQMLVHAVSTFTVPAWLLAPLAMFPAVAGTRMFGGFFARALPRDETQSISQDELVGRVATIVLGEARPGSAAQAKVRDRFGRQHYVLVEPDEAEAVFAQGSIVLLVSRHGAMYRCIANANPSLTP
jgi:membrane protein implicated in regulation of membrane protease activity